MTETKPVTKPDSVCCPPFDPGPWIDTRITWEGKKFIKDHVRTAFYMPLNFGHVMRRLDGMVKGTEARVPDYLCLSEHTSMWNMDVYLAVDDDIPGAENITLYGRYYSKVYEGPFKDTGKWMKDAIADSKSKGMAIKKWYMWYTTCPKCAKKYGKNYVVVLGEVA